MSTIVTRAGKGSPLTHNEVDANFTNLNTDKYQSGDVVTFASAVVTGSATINGTSIPNNKTLVVTTDIGSSVQAYDAQLADIAGLTPTDNNFIVGNGTNFVTESGSTARTSLGLGTIATQDANNVSITGGQITGITDLAVADGGTGASDASTARTNLGLAIGTNVQAYSAELQGISQGGNIGMKNRIINGAMVIDQRNAGAAVNANGGNQTFPVDRFYSQVYNTTGNTTGQQSTTAPAGFTNSLRLSCQTADTSVGATDLAWYGQNIEGFNIADFDFGKSTAKTITLSFWVYSNVTGTYCVALKNNAEGRSYIAEYTVSASNTWEYKTITIAGDTAGTWLTNNGVGLKIWFVLMAGSSQQTTANTWTNASGVVATSNQVNFLSSTSNVMFLTGVQLEVGSTATSFDYRPYTTELQLCQRYFQVFQSQTSVEYAFFGIAIGYGSTFMRVGIPAQVQMRATPTLGSSAAGTFYLEGGYANSISAITGYGTTNRNLFVWQVTTPTTSSGASWFYAFNTASAFLTANAEL